MVRRSGVERNENENVIPQMAYNYARKIAESTGQSIETVLESSPVKKYISKIRGQ